MIHIHTLGKRLFTITVLLVAVLFPVGVSAAPMSGEDLEAILQTSEWHSTKAYTSCNSSGSVTLWGKDNAEKVYNFLIAKGLQPFQAAGIMGNMTAESNIEPQRLQNTPSGTITPAESVNLNGLGWGLVQWTPPGKFISTQNPISQANDLGVQIAFVWDQLEGRTTIPEKQAGDDVKASTSLEDAVVAFQGNLKTGGPYRGYERPLDEAASVPDRIAAARDILNTFGSNSPTSGGTTPSTGTDTVTGCAGGVAGGGLGVGAGGFTFPQVTTQTRIKNQQPWVWCFDSQTSCHHDYPAADIFNDVGTQVVAAVGGKVITHSELAVCTGVIGGSSNLQIEGDDGNYYFYTHMIGKLDVALGDTVKAGQPLGRIGPPPCAQGAPPHLHFQAYTSRITGNTTAMNVQPALIDAFNKLPQ